MAIEGRSESDIVSSGGSQKILTARPCLADHNRELHRDESVAFRRVLRLVSSGRKTLETKGAMSYTGCMTIEHHIVTDADGKPVAAQIPWGLFQQLQALHTEIEEAPLSDESKAELDRRVQGLKNGTTKAIPHEEVIADLHSIID